MDATYTLLKELTEGFGPPGHETEIAGLMRKHLPQPAQAMLLRALATGEFRPLGATRSRSADVRVVSATNRELNELVMHLLEKKPADRPQNASIVGDAFQKIGSWLVLNAPTLQDDE